MKRTLSRRLRNHAEYAHVAGHADHYIGKHENLDGIMAELSAAVEEMTEALELTEHFIAEVVEKSANHLRKIAEKIHLRMPTMKIPVRKSVLEYICGKAVIPCVG